MAANLYLALLFELRTVRSENRHRRPAPCGNEYFPLGANNYRVRIGLRRQALLDVAGRNVDHRERVADVLRDIKLLTILGECHSGWEASAVLFGVLYRERDRSARSRLLVTPVVAKNSIFIASGGVERSAVGRERK